MGAGDCGTCIVFEDEDDGIGSACTCGGLFTAADDIDPAPLPADSLSLYHLFSTYTALTNDRRRVPSVASGIGKSCCDHLASRVRLATAFPPLFSFFTSSGVNEDMPIDFIR